MLRRSKLVLVSLAALGMVVANASAATVTTLATLQPVAGANGSPGGLAIDPAGNLYGTTSGGGPLGGGTVFKVTPDGVATRLSAFGIAASGGYAPAAGVLRGADGSLYGTTEGGGAPSSSGVVFKLAPDNTRTTLVTFTGLNGMGSTPRAGLIADAAGNLYGNTYHGGTNNAGTVFKVAPDGTFTTLASLSSTSGAAPWAELVADPAGNLYGTTTTGGPGGAGTVFKLTPGGTLSVLASFSTARGTTPRGALTIDKAGNLYGTTSTDGPRGGGTVFKVTPAGVFSTLASFNGDVGYKPMAGVLLDAAGNLYGTTSAGFNGNYGAVYRLSTDGTLTTLVSFNGPNGAYPVGELVADATGNLYGVSGSTSTNGSIIFKVSDAGFVVAPEPASLSALAAAAAVLLRRRRRP